MQTTAFNHDHKKGKCHDEHHHHHDHYCGNCGSGGHEHNLEHGNSWLMPGLSAILLISGIIVQHTTSIFDNGILSLCWYLAAFLPVGIGVLKEALEGIAGGDIFNEFTLMSIASIGAFAIGEYPEGVAVMLLYTVGENLQHGAVYRATRNISKLLDVRPERTMILREGSLVEVDPKQVKVGETIEVKPGERIPLDGQLLNEVAEFDTSALTGESIPRLIQKDEDVMAGMIVIGSPVRIIVSRPYEKSTLSRILNLVQEAADRKAPAELFIRRFARIYTPVVMLLAVLLVTIPAVVAQFSNFEYHFSEWLYRALVFLVISCPCALVISVPLGYYAGIGAASRLGILFKGGNYLDALTNIDSIAFDKTGTLTKGRFDVEDVVMASGYTRQYLIDIAMSMELKSTHPIAVAIVDFARAEGATPVTIDGLKENAGNGMEGLIDGRKILLGNFRLLDSYGISVPAELKQSVSTVVLCAVDGLFAGALILADGLKSDAARAISELKALGVEDIHLLSGDKQEIVRKYADELGISDARAELLPEEKAEVIDGLVNVERRTVAFVGDGMNDAPVLALSNVGIAMGGVGSDAAVESADVVIQNDMPSRVATALRIARATKTVVRENIVGAISVKLVVLVAGAMGFASLWAAVFADVGVALLAVANSMRLLYKKY